MENIISLFPIYVFKVAIFFGHKSVIMYFSAYNKGKMAKLTRIPGFVEIHFLT